VSDIHPPGRYKVVVVGSGPGGLQISYFLNRLGIDHAVISADQEPGGMFRRFPLFQRLISWTKPYAPADRTSRAYEWYDWNSLLGEEPNHKALVAEFVQGNSYFPSRGEMEQGLRAFSARAGIKVRYGCRWEATGRRGELFSLETSDGLYECDVAIMAIGTTEAWKPSIPGIDEVPHYVAAKPREHYTNKKVFIIGKRNSGLEVADALLPVARQIILGSPRPARLSVLERSLMGARARYLQPYEDHVLGGGHVLVNASIERIERSIEGYRVHASSTTRPAAMVFDVDEVIAATGFSTPLLDLPKLGAATLNQGRLPAQTAFWESASLPGIYFAGSATQGSAGLKKYGIGSNSAAVHGFRYNARILAHHIAKKHFGVKPSRPLVKPDDLVPFILSEMTRAPELWNQQAYLARVMNFEPKEGILDEGIAPLEHFVDSNGPDAIAVTIETDGAGEIHPVVYLRRSGKTQEHPFEPDPLRDFETVELQHQVKSLLKPYLS